MLAKEEGVSEKSDLKTLMLGKIEGTSRRVRQRLSWLGSITDSVSMNLSKLQEMTKDRRVGHD